jgi:hypothetical protein
MLLGLAMVLQGIVAASVEASICTEPILFRTPSLRDIDARPARLALADLNHDGILDLVVTTPESSTGEVAHSIDVMFGTVPNGAQGGGFTAPRAVPCGGQPEGVAIADFNHDGQPDLAVTNWADGTVSILRGDGGREFTAPPLTFPCGETPHGIAVGDFDRDGILDLVVANDLAGTVSVLRGLGSGAFEGPRAIRVGDLAVSAVAADLNGDGNLDILVANQPGVAVLLGNGNGTFHSPTQYPTGGRAYALAVADLNADGKADVVVGNEDLDGFALLMGIGSGTFGPMQSYESGRVTAASIVPADFDGDGLLDLAVADATGDQILVFRNLGDAAFALHSSYVLAGYPLALAVSDLDGDGKSDLVASAYLSSKIAVMMGTCQPAAPPIGAPHLVSVTDVPEDNGHQVVLRWTRSPFDSAGIMSITGYRVWRRLPGSSAVARTRIRSHALKRHAGDAASSVDYWEPILTIPAEGLAGYGCVAPTLIDSTRAHPTASAFFVTALTSDDAVFFESNIDSGGSVDNLPPHPPGRFTVRRGATRNSLEWGGGSADPVIFRLFRGVSTDFVANASSEVIATADTAYSDIPGAWCYKLAAVDDGGNVSLVVPATAIDERSPELELLGPRANPVRQQPLTVEFSLAASATASACLELFDVSGRLMESREVGNAGAGRHMMPLTSNLPAGFYMVRLRQGEAQRSVRCLVLP